MRFGVQQDAFLQAPGLPVLELYVSRPFVFPKAQEKSAQSHEVDFSLPTLRSRDFRIQQEQSTVAPDCHVT